MAAVAETGKKDADQAERYLQKSIAAYDNPETWMVLADLQYRLGKTPNAINSYKHVSNADENNLESRHRLIELFLKQGDQKGAQEALQELTLKEHSVENYQLLAQLHLKIGNQPGAVKALEDAIKLRPADVELLNQLTRALAEWSAQLAKTGKLEESASVRGHAERVAEQISLLVEKRADQVLKVRPRRNGPPIALTSSRIWLAKGSYTPEGEIEIKNVFGEPVAELSLTMVFYDNTARQRTGTVTIPVATATSPPFVPNEKKKLYFSCPNIVNRQHQLAVIIFWQGRLIKELPVVKQR